jgi:hypothetical protein
MDKTMSDALMMLTKVNSKLVDKLAGLEKKVDKQGGGDSKATSQPEKLYKKPQSVVIEDFNRDAMQDLFKVFGASQQESVKAPEVKTEGKGGSGLMKALMSMMGIGIGIAGLGVAFGAADAVIGKLGGGGNLKELMLNIGAGLGGFTGTGLIALGSLLGAGALFGAVGGLGTSFKVAVGMTAIGAGLGGFFAGLALGDKGAGALNSDGSSIKNLMINLAEGLGAFTGSSMVALTVLLGAGALFGAVGGPAIAGQAAIGMGLIGLGLGGFFAGLAVGDKGAGALNSDGSSIKKLMINLAEGLGAFSGSSMVALTVLLGAGALFGPAAGSAAVGMGLIGVGLGAFFTGLAANDAVIGFMSDGDPGGSIKTLMINMAEGLGAFGEVGKSLDMTDILKVPTAAIAISTAMVTLGAGNLAGAVLDGLAKVGRFLMGGDNPFDQMMLIGEKADKLDAGANAIERLTTAMGKLKTFADFKFEFKLKDFADDLMSSLPGIEAAIMGGTVDGWFSDKEFLGLASPKIKFQQAADNISLLKSAFSLDTGSQPTTDNAESSASNLDNTVLQEMQTTNLNGFSKLIDSNGGIANNINTNNELSLESNTYQKMQIELLKQNVEILSRIQNGFNQSNNTVDNSSVSVYNTGGGLRNLQRSYV